MKAQAAIVEYTNAAEQLPILQKEDDRSDAKAIEEKSNSNKHGTTSVELFAQQTAIIARFQESLSSIQDASQRQALVLQNSTQLFHELLRQWTQLDSREIDSTPEPHGAGWQSVGRESGTIPSAKPLKRKENTGSQQGLTGSSAEPIHEAGASGTIRIPERQRTPYVSVQAQSGSPLSAKAKGASTARPENEMPRPNIPETDLRFASLKEREMQRGPSQGLEQTLHLTTEHNALPPPQDLPLLSHKPPSVKELMALCSQRSQIRFKTLIEGMKLWKDDWVLAPGTFELAQVNFTRWEHASYPISFMAMVPGKSNQVSYPVSFWDGIIFSIPRTDRHEQWQMPGDDVLLVDPEGSEKWLRSRRVVYVRPNGEAWKETKISRNGQRRRTNPHQAFVDVFGEYIDRPHSHVVKSWMLERPPQTPTTTRGIVPTIAGNPYQEYSDEGGEDFRKEKGERRNKSNRLQRDLTPSSDSDSSDSMIHDRRETDQRRKKKSNSMKDTIGMVAGLAGMAAALGQKRARDEGREYSGPVFSYSSHDDGRISSSFSTGQKPSSRSGRNSRTEGT